MVAVSETGVNEQAAVKMRCTSMQRLRVASLTMARAHLGRRRQCGQCVWRRRRRRRRQKKKLVQKMLATRALTTSTMLRRASSSSACAARRLRSFSTSLPPPPPPPRSPARDGVVIPSGSVAVPRASKYMPGFSFPAPRKLETIVKYALLEREPPAEVERIWLDHHAGRLDSVAAAWPPSVAAAVRERARRCPRFVFPVFKPGGGYFVLLAEWQDRFCIFTYLDDYRRSPGAAQPYLSLALYDDWLARKQLLLVRGDFSAHLRKADAAHLLQLVLHFYATEPRAVETFNHEPAAFNWADHLRDCPKPAHLTA